MTETHTYSDIVFVAPESMADQIDQLKPGQLTSTSDFLRDDVWEAISAGERRVLERFVETLVFEELVPLERVGFDDDGQNLYRRIDV